MHYPTHELITENVNSHDRHYVDLDADLKIDGFPVTEPLCLLCRVIKDKFPGIMFGLSPGSFTGDSCYYDLEMYYPEQLSSVGRVKWCNHRERYEIFSDAIANQAARNRRFKHTKVLNTAVSLVKKFCKGKTDEEGINKSFQTLGSKLYTSGAEREQEVRTVLSPLTSLCVGVNSPMMEELEALVDSGHEFTRFSTATVVRALVESVRNYRKEVLESTGFITTLFLSHDGASVTVYYTESRADRKFGARVANCQSYETTVEALSEELQAKMALVDMLGGEDRFVEGVGYRDGPRVYHVVV